MRFLTSTCPASPFHNTPQEASASASVEPGTREGKLGALCSSWYANGHLQSPRSSNKQCSSAHLHLASLPRTLRELSNHPQDNKKVKSRDVLEGHLVRDDLQGVLRRLWLQKATRRRAWEHATDKSPASRIGNPLRRFPQRPRPRVPGPPGLHSLHNHFGLIDLQERQLLQVSGARECLLGALNFSRAFICD